MKQLFATAAMVGALISFATPVYASTLPSAPASAQTAVQTAQTATSHVTATPDYGFLPEE